MSWQLRNCRLISSREFSLLKNVQTSSGAPQSSTKWLLWVSLGHEADRDINPVTRLNMKGALPPWYVPGFIFKG